MVFVRSGVVFRDSFSVSKIIFWGLSLNVKWGFAEIYESCRESRFRGNRDEEPLPDLNGNDFKPLINVEVLIFLYHLYDQVSCLLFS